MIKKITLRVSLKVLAISVLTASLSLSARAGMPIDEQIKCPIGGEEFTITSTASCSSMGHTLSLRPITSCDFVTRLPVCPSNKFPIYGELEESQIEAAKMLIESQEYKSSMKAPKYYRAWQLAKQLEPSGSIEPFLILQDGLHYDLENSKSHPEYISAYKETFEEAKANFKSENLPFYVAAYSFFLFNIGEKENAKLHLNDALENSDQENDYFTMYSEKLKECFELELDDETCSSNSPIPRN